jgi:hypothetical protein
LERDLYGKTERAFTTEDVELTEIVARTRLECVAEMIHRPAPMS